jgi:sirohydrochlorin ferrochelatase
MRQLNRFQAIRIAFLEEVPSLDEVLNTCAADTENAVLLGLFAAEGPHAMQDVPSMLAAWQRKARQDPALGANSLLVHYAGVVGTRPEIVKLIQDSVSRCARRT